MPKYATEAIRNVALVGSAGSGKTTLAEAMLHAVGAIGRAGRIEDGNTVCDYDDLEKEFKRSLDSSLVHFDHGGAHINLIDTAGGSDFMGRTLSALPAIETAVVVLDAAGVIDAVARRVMAAAKDQGLARLIVINKIDHATDLADYYEGVQEIFGSACRPVNLPTNGGKGIVDCFTNATGTSDLGDVEGFHTGLVDQVVETDDALMERYLEQGEVEPGQLRGPLKNALRSGHLVPVLFTSARNGIGVKELLGFIPAVCPAPAEGPDRFVEAGTDSEVCAVTLAPDSARALVAHVFRITSDPYVGKLAVFRVLQGQVAGGAQVHVDDKNRPVRIAHIFKLQGKDHAEIPLAIAGDIAAVAKIDELHYNSVIHTGTLAKVHVKPTPLPRPMFGLAVEGTSKGSETKLAEALAKLVAEDPTLMFDRVAATGETVLRGLGEQHLRIKLRMLKERYGVDVQTRPPRVAYKETITSKADGHHRHKKQTGGAGQFGEVYLRVEPIPAAERDQAVDGLLFVDETVGGSIPRQYLPAVEKGIRQVMSHGAIAGYPMQGIKVEVYDGKYHPVDSKEIAFTTAGRKAFIDGVQKARPVLLEPYVTLEIAVPADLIGDISSDISGRRGRIHGTDMLPGNQVVITAEAPLSEVMTYSSQLKSITGGSGSYSMAYSHDEPTPPQIQEEVIKQYKPKAEED